tara:strand:- start:12 stop:203 length:192 start_codon:yes stop_codon:yes gene_type:complete
MEKNDDELCIGDLVFCNAVKKYGVIIDQTEQKDSNIAIAWCKVLWSDQTVSWKPVEILSNVQK